MGILSTVSGDEAAEAWIRAHVEPVGRTKLVHERPWGTVRRVPIAGGVAWFKACASAHAFEARLTAALASRWPDRLPCVVASDEERAWLLLYDAGDPLGFDGDPEPWFAVLPRYAELQRGETAHALGHVAGGVPERRIATLPALYDSMLERELPVRSGDLARLRTFAPRFAELCDELAAHDIAETIQHDDLHGGNVYKRNGTLRILDWGDACVSHPFLTFFVTFLHLEEMLPSDGPWFERLRDAYLEPWGPPSGLHEAFALAQRLGAFAHVFKELRVLDAIPREARQQFAPDVPVLLGHCVAATD